MSHIENINTKNIWDFDTNDTIYIRVKSKDGQFQKIYHCQFSHLTRNTVYGKVISVDVNAEINKGDIGKTVCADIKNCALYGVTDGLHKSYHWFNAMGYAYKDIGEIKTDEVIRHPSFGMVGLSRRSSSGYTPLFGSNIQHSQTITLTIKRAENNRHLNNDFFHGLEQLIEIEMSGSQYAELISSFNIGDGIPCTIRQFDKHSYPDPPYENPIDIFQREFSAKINNIGKECKSMTEDAFKMLKDKPTINKSDREFILNSINMLVQQINSNIPFISQEFNESMEKTVSQAKMEIETFVTNRITALGIDAAKQNPSLFLSGLNTEKKQIE